MKARKKKNKSSEDLKFDNEFRKVKLQMEKGASFHSQGNLSPEIENQFLNNIDRFDKAFESAKQLTVFEKLGKPGFRKVNRIPDSELKKELDSVRDKLEKKGIVIDSIHKVDDREMYRFITEELFQHETDDMSLSNWITHFTYEEFHPNHEYDVKDHTFDFVKEILGNKTVEGHLLCSKIKTSDGKIIPCEETLKKINSQRSFYLKFDLEKFEVTSLKINSGNTSGKILFEVRYLAKIDGSNEKQIFNGTGNAVLKNEYGCNWWTIYQFNMPGFEI